MSDAFADTAAWSNNWLWGAPLIVLTVLLHCAGLILIHENMVLRIEATPSRRRLFALMALIVAIAVLLLTVLHAIEAAVWALDYVALGARPDAASAMLYSLSAMTAYGHANVYLAEHWQLMGALEALNGMMLFGLTTAFLFSVLQSSYRIGAKESAPKAAARVPSEPAAASSAVDP
jgi:hypothetical protein